jgi:hypothetical protein
MKEYDKLLLNEAVEVQKSSRDRYLVISLYRV